MQKSAVSRPCVKSPESGLVVHGLEHLAIKDDRHSDGFQAMVIIYMDQPHMRWLPRAGENSLDFPDHIAACLAKTLADFDFSTRWH